MAACPSPKKLFAYLDGALSRTEATGVRIHLEACAACAPRFARMQRVRAALRDIGEKAPVPPRENPAAEARILAAVGAKGPPRGGVQWWWLPVTAAATLVLAFVVFPRLRGVGDAATAEGPDAVATAGEQGAPAAGDRHVGVLVVIRGAVEIGRAGGEFRSARAGDPLDGAAVVRCAAGGEARIELAGGGVLTLRDDTEIEMPEDRDGIIRLHGGTVEAVVEPRPEGRRPFGIETSVARIEAIGTRFEVTHRDGETVLSVAEGKVRFVSLRSDEEILVASGDRARVDARGGVQSERALVAAATAQEPAVEEGAGEEHLVRAGREGGAATVEDSSEPSTIDEAVRVVRRCRGTIDGGPVRARVSRRRGALQACYTDYALRSRPVTVEARARFTVLEDGAVGEFAPNLSVDDRELAACIERVFRAIRFPAPSGGCARVFYPVSLGM